MRSFKCKYCGTECVTRDKRSVICKSPECVKKYNRENYASKLIKKTCKICGIEYIGTQKSATCSKECTIKSHKIATRKSYKKHDTIIEEVTEHCKYCGDVVKTSTVYMTPNRLKQKKSKLVCKKCVALHRKEVSENMKGEKNVNWKGGLKKKILTKEEVSTLQSKRMLGDNNPMKRPDVREKVSRYWKEHPIAPIRGQANHRWKGLSERKHLIRTRLYKSFVLPCLERDGFKCVICESKKKLEVHHITPFREILKKHLTKLGKTIDSLTDDEFEELSTAIEKEHTLDIGKTLCEECHKKEDKFRNQFHQKPNED